MRKWTENLSPEETLHELILCPWFPSIKFHIICSLYQCSLPNTCPWLIKSYLASLLKMTHWVILPRNICSSPRKAVWTQWLSHHNSCHRLSDSMPGRHLGLCSAVSCCLAQRRQGAPGGTLRNTDPIHMMSQDF